MYCNRGATPARRFCALSGLSCLQPSAAEAARGAGLAGDGCFGGGDRGGTGDAREPKARCGRFGSMELPRQAPGTR